MSSKLSFLRRYIVPQFIANAVESVGASAPHPSGNSYYSKAIKNMLGEITGPVMWSKSGMTDDIVDLKSKSLRQISDILKSESSTPFKAGDVPPSAVLKDTVDDVVMNEADSVIGKYNTIVGSYGGGTGSAFAHELGHIKDIQRNPTPYYMYLMAPRTSPIGEVVELAGGRGVLGSHPAYLASKSPTLLGEIMASAYANKAMASTKAPASIRIDMLKRQAPALGSYFFPAIEQTL